MNPHHEASPMQEAGMYDLLADYYKYTNPNLHIFYYQKHLQSLQKAFEQPNSIFPDTQRQKEYGKIRMLHASLDTPAVDIYINGIRIFKELSFKKMSNDLTLPVGKYQIDIYEADKMVDTYCSQKVMVESNLYHTFAFIGQKEKLKIYSYNEHPHVPYGETKLRFIHLASKTTDTLKIAVQNGDVIFPKLEAKTASSYLALSPMTVYLEARKIGTNELLSVFQPLVLKENKAYSAILLETNSPEYPIEVLLFAAN
ncbi:DUF4397 domain-containing protein [Niallia nealsonii]|nr:DUF4397 domain-containing protein [Niallia nealsonii]